MLQYAVLLVHVLATSQCTLQTLQELKSTDDSVMCVQAAPASAVTFAAYELFLGALMALQARGR